MSRQAVETVEIELYKVVLLGESASGKTTLLKRYNGDSSETETTIGVEFEQFVIQCSDNKRVKLQIWDTAGQEKYRSIIRSYYRGAHAYILLCDLTNASALDHLKYWSENVKQNGLDGAKVLLIGNKSDLLQNPDTGELEDFARQENYLGYRTCSAIKGEGVREAFRMVAEALHAPQVKQVNNNTLFSSTSTPLKLDNNEEQTSSSCCSGPK